MTDKNEILKIALQNEYSCKEIAFIIDYLKATVNEEIIKLACEKASDYVVDYLFINYKFPNQEIADTSFELAINNKKITKANDHTIETRMFKAQTKFKPNITQELLDKIPENHSIKSFLNEKFEEQQKLETK